ncbi:hypothetical protein SORBI_3003G140550 [Sorghum bicolor]|uniref:Uncharacterized protein n=1 Tax=Sorghum bicolor TaxID=4558 RepID=A0A1W0VXD5_SORBI|nr:hypothetical protein SORBI_3003G140550 [Sorghum bicolor]
MFAGKSRKPTYLIHLLQRIQDPRKEMKDSCMMLACVS